MADGPKRTPRQLARCGIIARALLADVGETQVIAVFERCFYLACPRGIVCIGTADIGAGPINAEVALPDGVAWQLLGVLLDAPGQSSGATAAIGDSLVVDVASGPTWTPPPAPTFDAELVRRGTARLHQLARPAPPDNGFAALVLGTQAADRPPAATTRAAQGPIETLARAFPSALATNSWSPDALRAAILLVGLGPGFTPSGDDVLGGLMLALTAAGCMELRDGLWHAIEPELDDLTVPASAMHLSAAADGMASEPVHLLLNEILLGGGGGMAASLRAVAKIGHTSGWDIVAGMMMGLEALAARPTAP